MLSVFSIVKERLSKELQTKEGAPYSKETLHITSSKNGTPTEFPTLNVDSLGELSTADCLKGNKQSAIISTIELKAYADDTQEKAREILDKAGDVMLSMGYAVIQGPEDVSNENHIISARFRRTVSGMEIKNL